ncbi:1-deoxy-D-xylulose-5-phosphate synthase N-terminal domain-containing protein [Streptomyces sp. NPDC055966]|uniref:1-deoxy-D-xylulose-5-phosphate synthase N-terminal domain-containing protein n=1 Tax=Streptomyces sp. NPDC055966 TaxID=3345669 RepID=UPI0035D945C4
MSLLARVNQPPDLKKPRHAQPIRRAGEIRGFLIRHVAAAGVHPGPNLGTAELPLALHRLLDSSRDRLPWHVRHHTHVHKVATGRAGEFSGLRQRGGLSGYLSREESTHDHIAHSPASAVLSYADGMAKAGQLAPETGRHIVTIVGNGAPIEGQPGRSSPPERLRAGPRRRCASCEGGRACSTAGCPGAPRRRRPSRTSRPPRNPPTACSRSARRGARPVHPAPPPCTDFRRPARAAPPPEDLCLQAHRRVPYPAATACFLLPADNTGPEER